MSSSSIDAAIFYAGIAAALLATFLILSQSDKISRHILSSGRLRAKRRQQELYRIENAIAKSILHIRKYINDGGFYDWKEEQKITDLILRDEDIQRLIGLSNFDYITNKLVNVSSEIIFPYYGVGYELPLILFEKLFKVNNIEDIFLFRHKIIFLTTIIGNIFYFFLLKKIFKSSYYALLGSLLLIISPRLFAESFYNSKDIIFMHSFIISVFFGLKFSDRYHKIHPLLSSF